MRRTLAALALERARVAGVELPVERLRLFSDGAGHGSPGGIDPAPGGIGEAYEAMLAAGARRSGGVHYTPPDIADKVVALAVDGIDVPVASIRCCDPAVGGGAFLLAAARAIEAAGVERWTIVEQHLFGYDIDPLAVAVTEAALSLWSGGAVAGDHLVVADALALGDAPAFDLVVGNPPFLNQLRTATARPRTTASQLGVAFGDAARGYADTASVFLVAATRLASERGRVALIQPQSFLAARDAGAAREAVLGHAALVALWVAGEQVFDAAVLVCAPVLEVGRTQPAGVRVVRGRSFTASHPSTVEAGSLEGRSSWAHLVAASSGVPATRPSTGGVLGDWCRATAGFRDQFYGLVPHVREADDHPRPRVVTSGLIDPAMSQWGIRPARIGGRMFRAPVVDLDDLPASLAAWVRLLLVAKVVVATQTRVLEVAVDRLGEWVPSVPVIAVVTEAERVDAVAAAMLAPPLSALALARFGGTARSTDAIKLSARQVLELPMPGDRGAWREGTRLLAAVEASATDGDEAGWRAALAVFGATMCRAYGEPADGEIHRWWMARLPGWRRTAGRTGGDGVG